MTNNSNSSGYCRLCAELKPYSQLIPINKNEESYTDLIYKVSQCFQIEISLDDNLPNTICTDCCTQTNISYEFFEKVHNAQKRLRTIVFDSGLKTSTDAESRTNINVKNEDIQINEYTKTGMSSESEEGDNSESVDTFSEEVTNIKDDPDSNGNRKTRLIRMKDGTLKKVLRFEEEFPNYKWCCSVCSSKLKSRKELFQHFRKEHNKSPEYACNECIKVFTLKQFRSFRIHIRQHSNDSNNLPRIDITDDLDKNDDRKSKIIRRKDGSVKRVLPSFEEEFPNYKWRCSVCSNILESRKKLLQHFEKEHNNSPEFSCNECDKIFPFNQYKNFKRHVRQHTNYLPCKFCEKVFKWKPTLERHIRFSHEQKFKYICSICSKEFKQPSSLKRHEQLHQIGPNRERYECDICHKMMLSKAILATHKQTHDESAKRFTCEKCGLSFRLKQSLELHIRNIHTFIPEDKYPECPICAKKLKSDKQVRHHVRYYHSAKRFECETCGKQFSLLGNYKDHLTLHTGELPYQCEYCKKRFRIKKGLTRHLLQHTGEKPYCCFDCNHDFTDFSNYIKHMKRKHGVTSFKKVKKVNEMIRADMQQTSICPTGNV